MTLSTATFLLLSILSLLTFSLSLVVSASPTVYLGCFADRTDVVQRALPLVQEISQEMTVSKCLTKCASLGFEYTGLEYKHECYCSDVGPRHEQLKEEQCQTECGGGGKEKCGGALSLSVWKQEGLEQPKFDADRPLVCLVMILKNEAHTILNTLRAVKDYIDCWQILDTGSTDGTQKVIRDYFTSNPSKLPLLAGKVIPGAIYEEPFVDYGATRNRILVLAKENVNPIFTLMLSADEEMLNPDLMRAFLNQMRFARGTQHGAYPVVMNTGLKFDSIRLARVDSGWRYRGRVHEYLSPPTGPYVALYRSPTHINVNFNATDGDRRFQSQFFIRKILEEDLVLNPNDTRAIYYLARTNSGINNHTEAYRYYKMLSERSHWDEEIYHGMVMRAIEAKYLNIPWQERQQMFLDAYLYRPNNMDALYSLAQDHFDSGRPLLSYIFALRAISIPMPPNLAAIENVLLRPTKFLYDYEGHRLLGFAAREIQEWEQCLVSYHHVLRVNPNDTIVQDRIKLCEQEMEKKGKYVQPEHHPEPQGAAVAEEMEEELEKDPMKRLQIVSKDAAGVGGKKKRRRRSTPSVAVDGLGVTAAEAFERNVYTDDDHTHSYGLHSHQNDQQTIGVHVDVSINYLILLLMLIVAIAAIYLGLKICSPERKERES